MKAIQKIALLIIIMSVEQINFCSSYGSYTTTQNQSPRNMQAKKVTTLDDFDNDTMYNNNQDMYNNDQEQFPGVGRRLNDSYTRSGQTYVNPNRQALKIDESPEGHADRLFQQAFITPEMQATTILGTRHLYIIDTTTHMPVLYEVQKGALQPTQRAMPKLDDIITQAKNLANTPGQVMQGKMLLEQAKFALQIAEYTAALQAAYDKKMEVYYFAGSFGSAVTKILQNRLEEVQNLLENITFRRAGETSTFSVAEGLYNNNLTVNNPNHKIIPYSNINAYISNNTFTTKDPIAGSNLLFKQCFIAQQALRGYEDPNNSDQKIINQAINNHVQEQNSQLYEFDAYPNFADMIMFLAPKIQNLKTRNMFYKYIRQAVQTALFIAKTESTSTFNRLFATHYISFDPVLTSLRDMEKTAHNLCLDRSQGATIEDVANKEMWDNLTNIALGIGVVGGAVASVWAYNNPKEAQKSYNYVKSFVVPEKSWLEQQYDKIATQYDKITAPKSKRAWDEELNLSTNLFKKAPVDNRPTAAEAINNGINWLKNTTSTSTSTNNNNYNSYDFLSA